MYGEESRQSKNILPLDQFRVQELRTMLQHPRMHFRMLNAFNFTYTSSALEFANRNHSTIVGRSNGCRLGRHVGHLHTRMH